VHEAKALTGFMFFALPGKKYPADKKIPQTFFRSAGKIFPGASAVRSTYRKSACGFLRYIAPGGQCRRKRRRKQRSAFRRTYIPPL